MSKTVLASGALKISEIQSLGSRSSRLTSRETCKGLLNGENNVCIQNREATNAFISGNNKINVKK